MTKKLSKEWILLGIFVILFVVFSVLSPDRFLSVGNVQSMMFQLPEFGIFAIAMMIVILTGGINLSLVSTAALSGIACAFVLTSMMGAGANVALSILAAMAAAFGSAVLCGILNGCIVSYIGVAAMIATLGTSTLFQGIALNITKGNAISGFPAEFFAIGNESVLGIPVPFLIFAGIVALTIVLLQHTPWGLSVYLVGSNKQASLYSGINVNKVSLKVYIFSAMLSALAAIIMMARYNSAKADYGNSYLMQSIAAAVLGGTNIAGGYGKVIGVVTAVAILQIMSSGMNILGIDRSLIDVLNGVILIVVLAIDFMIARPRKKRAAMGAAKAA